MSMQILTTEEMKLVAGGLAARRPENPLQALIQLLIRDFFGDVGRPVLGKGAPTPQAF
jgi:hypothetical protein